MTLVDRFFNKFWKNVPLPKIKVEVGDYFYKIPRIVHNNIYKSSYQDELWLDDLLGSLNMLNPIDNFVDVGVNVGQTLLKIKSINPNVKYYGIEPSPFCCSFTQQIISINSLENCKIIPCGLGDKTQILELFISDDSNVFDSSASLVKGFRKKNERSSHFVIVLKMDEIVRNLNLDRISVIKIDIEGAELEAFIGMTATLSKYQPIVIMEVLPSYDELNKFRLSRQRKLADIISKLEYGIFHIRKTAGLMYFEKVTQFPIHKNINESDYLLLPKDINLHELGLEPK